MDRELRVLVGQHTEACIAPLAQIAGDETIRPEGCLVAMGMLLDHAHGKVQPVVTESDGKDDKIVVTIRSLCPDSTEWIRRYDGVAVSS